MIRKIYLVKFNDGCWCATDDEKQYTFKYCYSSKMEANKAIEELKENREVLKDYIGYRDDFNLKDVHFWIEELELVD